MNVMRVRRRCKVPYIIGGILCAIIACLPNVYLLEKTKVSDRCPSFIAALVGIVGSYVFLAASMVIVIIVTKMYAFVFSMAVVVTFLAFWGIETASVTQFYSRNTRGVSEGRDEL
ncbi:hypothetical protein HMPREF3192_00319 [Atopobium deltae]|uniref:Lipoprotein n=1 Tax=Atopobium deltae TaxID=1393034 RepID=A0A133XWD3_9ACTN|nr:hypothetical protein HMPREF3192_00319 [Atopobium deltae]